MANNLIVELVELQGNPDLGMPNPWQVKVEWKSVDGSGLLRTWSVDAPSELVAKTIETAINNMTDSAYGQIITQGYDV